MRLDIRFSQALSRLESWYADSVKAQAYDGDKTSHTKPGAVELKLQTYPDAGHWRHLYRTARNEAARVEVVEEVEREYENLAFSPSHKNKYVINTLEWKQAIGTHGGEARYVARLYGVGLSTVYKYRKLYSQGT